jgi:hypothetical protein
LSHVLDSKAQCLLGYCAFSGIYCVLGLHVQNMKTKVNNNKTEKMRDIFWIVVPTSLICESSLSKEPSANVCIHDPDQDPQTQILQFQESSKWSQ